MPVKSVDRAILTVQAPTPKSLNATRPLASVVLVSRVVPSGFFRTTGKSAMTGPELLLIVRLIEPLVFEISSATGKGVVVRG